MPERLLLSRARRGDQDAVAELYRDHIGAALKYARSIAPSIADAEDLVAESFTRVIAQLAMDRGPDSSFRAYLFTTMRHRLYSANRREYAVDDERVLDRPFHDRPAEDNAEHELLRQAFDTLTPHEQEVLLLLDVHELRPTEVCSRLGLRASALSMRAGRARNALAEAFVVAHLRPGLSRECATTRQMLGRHVRGTLSNLRGRGVSAHLETCESCREAVAEATEVNRGLRAIPIFGIPAAAAPKGWRTWLSGRGRGGLRHGLNSSHLGVAPTAMKAAVLVAALCASTGAAVALTSGAQHHSATTTTAKRSGAGTVTVQSVGLTAPSSSSQLPAPASSKPSQHRHQRTHAAPPVQASGSKSPTSAAPTVPPATSSSRVIVRAPSTTTAPPTYSPSPTLKTPTPSPSTSATPQASLTPSPSASTSPTLSPPASGSSTPSPAPTPTDSTSSDDDGQGSDGHNRCAPLDVWCLLQSVLH